MKQVEDGEVSPAKDLEIAKLNTELGIVRRELQKVIELYTTSPPVPSPSVTVEVVFSGSKKSLAQDVCTTLVAAGFQAHATAYENWVVAVRARLGGANAPHLPSQAIFVRDRSANWLKAIQRAVSPLVGGQVLENPAIDNSSAEAFGIGADEALIVLR